MKKVLVKLSALLLAAVLLLLAVSIVGCKKDDDAGDRVRIVFYPSSSTHAKAMRNLVEHYNDTQGKIDGVYVKADYTQIDSSSNHYSMCPENVQNVADILTVSDRYLFYGAGYASGSFYTDLSALFADESLRTKDADGNYVLDLSSFSEGSLNRFYFDRETGTAGDPGTGSLWALPYGSNPTFLIYNEDYFKAADIHIISVKEEDLDAYNAAHGTSYAPRGYCEYTPDATPEAGLKTSRNLDGKEVVKVFNNLIPMNYIELNTLSKWFTQSYNSASQSVYGVLNEWWFSHGWPVGGNSVAWDAEKGQHVFSLGDSTQSYMVTADVTIDGTVYHAGDVLGYNARRWVADHAGEVDMNCLYTIPTEYEQFRDFCALSQKKGVKVDDDFVGYGISPDPNSFSNSSKTKYFTTGQVAMLVESFGSLSDIMKMTRSTVNAAPVYTYREFEGEGQHGNDTLQIVGENGFTGKLKTVSRTVIRTAPVSSSDNLGYAIPANSTKKEAAFKFLQYLCSEAGQKYTVEDNAHAPTNSAYAESEEFASQAGKLVENYAAIGMMADNAQIGDWSYCGDKEWINDWSVDLNGPVRNGNMTLNSFFDKWTARINDGADGYQKNLKQAKYMKIKWIGLR